MEDIQNFLIIVTLVHCSIYVIDTIFKTCLFLPYFGFLRNTGFEVKPFRFHWYTTALNRLIQKWGSTRPKFAMAWFSTGSVVAVIMLPLAVILLIRSIYLIAGYIIREESDFYSTIGSLQPMVPGWNIPLSELGYYLFTLLICTVVHEAGHAIAAVREVGRVNGVGVVLLFCVPVAYVSLDNLEVLPSMRRLRVLCAGVWHNVVLALVALCVMAATPWLVLPFYNWGSGVQIQAVQQQSPLFGVGGLVKEDVIVQVNGCSVTDIASWQNCLAQAARWSTPGYCLPSEFIKEHDESVPAKHLAAGVVECCSSNAPRHLCFEYLERGDEPLQLPQFSCLNARTVVQHSTDFCYKSSDCENSLHCFRPSLENNTKLVTMRVKSERTVLFLGHPADVFHSLTISDYTNLYRTFPSHIPDRITLLCHYIVTFSIGMAIINVIPCFYFDGQHIARSLMDVLLTKHIEHPSVRHAMSLCCTFLGTFILLFYLVLALWSAI